MHPILTRILTFALMSVAIYFGITATLIVVGKPRKPHDPEKGLSFDELFFDTSSLPELETFEARDGATLAYRHYPADADTVLILLHGSGWHSSYLLPLAEFVSGENLAHVYTPDLRGHGLNPARRGDIDYVAQLEDDIADLIALIKQQHPDAPMIVGGHSSGGGLALRFAGSEYGQQAAAYLLLAPYLQYNAPTARPNSGGWARPYTPRIAGLTMLNNVGIRWFNHLTAIDFNMPEKARNGTETLAYSFRLNTGFAPRNYKKDLRAITQPLLVVAGTADEAFYAEKYEPVITQYTEAQVELLDGATHMGAVVDPRARPVIRTWLEKMDEELVKE
jgi:alpha-beta hydrolase superfamily lysophospholipase